MNQIDKTTLAGARTALGNLQSALENIRAHQDEAATTAARVTYLEAHGISEAEVLELATAHARAKILPNRMPGLEAAANEAATVARQAFVPLCKSMEGAASAEAGTLAEKIAGELGKHCPDFLAKKSSFEDATLQSGQELAMSLAERTSKVQIIRHAAFNARESRMSLLNSLPTRSAASQAHSLGVILATAERAGRTGTFYEPAVDPTPAMQAVS